MKKTFLLILTILLLTEMNGQVTKRNWMLGGVINYSSTSYKSENFGPKHIAYNLQIEPNVGYFLADKFAAGVKVGINKSGVKDPSTPGYNKYTDFNIGPYMRYYFLNTGKTVNILMEGAYQYGFEKGNVQSLSKSFFLASAGPVVYFNETVGLEFLVSYSTYKFSGVKGSNNTIMFGLGLQVHLQREE